MKPLRIATALAMLATPAYAKIDKKCLKEIKENTGFTLAQAKRICNSNNYVKPNELGWGCLLDAGVHISKDYPGGARLKRDAVCE
jgi:hypothetical protein